MGSRIVVSAHGAWQLARRQIPPSTADAVASRPEQVIDLRPGRQIRHGMVAMRPSPRLYLVRVVVDVRDDDVRIVTAYRTTRIGRYWRLP